MGFQPQMQAELRGIGVVRPLRFRAWAGVVADVWHARGEPGGGGRYLSPHPRVVVFLDDGADAIELSLADGRTSSGAAALFVPPMVPVQSRILSGRGFSHLDLHLDAAMLARRLSAALPDLAQPLFCPRGGRLSALAQMLAAEVETPARHDLLIDGLLQALLAEVFALPPDGQAVAGARGGLAPHQLAAVNAHVRARLQRRVSVAEMAQVAGLSESWFAHAFKQTTGATPQRWLMQQRLQAARAMMEAGGTPPLAEVAAATGFADQAHLTRAFRAAYGLPPAAWRRQLS